MTRTSAGTLVLGIGLWMAGCSKPASEAPQSSTGAAGPHGAYRIYVTNETSGDLTVIDSSAISRSPALIRSASVPGEFIRAPMAESSTLP